MSQVNEGAHFADIETFFDQLRPGTIVWPFVDPDSAEHDARAVASSWYMHSRVPCISALSSRSVLTTYRLSSTLTRDSHFTHLPLSFSLSRLELDRGESGSQVSKSTGV